MIWHPSVGKGDLLATVTGSIDIDMTGAVVGDEQPFEIDHSDMLVENSSVSHARFDGAPMPTFDGIGGYQIIPIIDGTDGNKFRAKLIYVGAPEDIYGYGYEYGYGAVPGVATVTWHREGMLQNNAD